ncbi:DEAD/DEAH box helicase [Streptomyces lunaelactis]|uniref:DEAD/DEAH box helicase n=1 Tax=Streptomyces lunaelactis TaxID=1535768 RepID=UPI0015854D1E|nr:DEAD/DEAH box helicase family protein [Streptomyces lunaelactis]NUL22835.1 DEAD/DEAH box helicase family protein [Streptomyces lunaelactis]
MSFSLTDYQSDAASSCIDELRDAQTVFVQRGKKTAVGLSAPTGAGKTVIATSVIERLMFGDDTCDDNPGLAVLWITDDPALNRQTLDKMLLASARFTDGDFVEVDSAFDKKRLDRGRIHFAHIHLFGKGTTSMQPSNSRETGLWEIIANTIEAYGPDFLLVIDEAHKGVEAKKDAATIIERISHGGTADHFTGQVYPPAPIIFGITATPERFKKAMDRAGRSLEMVDVPVSEVRESGLLKDKIIVRHPGDNQPAESTLLAQAVVTLKQMDEAWRAHTEATGAPLTEPLLVVQVRPGTSDAELGSYLSSLESEWSLLKGDAIAHSFESHAILTLPRDREIRYVAPDRIAADSRVRVVLFKSALTTGWDCPRAEVMLSFRVAKDYTNIAQLIGRMVRTPLAERIETDESLNSVTLYLPHYSKAEVAKVVQALSDDTGGEIEVTVEPVDCGRNPAVPQDCFALLASLPSAARVKKSWRSETHRLLGLARLLRGHGLVADAGAQVQARLVGAIRTEASVRASEVEARVRDVLELDMSETVWDNRRGQFIDADDERSVLITAKVQDIESQFKSAVRALPDATAKWYWNSLCEEMDEPDDAKAHAAALTKTSEMATAFRKVIEKAATAQIEAWRGEYANKVSMLSRQARTEFEATWNPRTGTLTVDIEAPKSISAPSETLTGIGENTVTSPVPTYDKHLYVAPSGHRVVPDGKYPFKAGSAWEIDVIEKELSYPSLVGWYRNPARSKHGLGIPYSDGMGWALMYPDFLFFHKVDGEIVVDVVDPHGHQGSDTGPKWAALAEWAQDNHDKVRRVVAVIKVADQLKALGLTADGIPMRLRASAAKGDIEAIFDGKSGLY